LALLAPKQCPKKTQDCNNDQWFEPPIFVHTRKPPKDTTERRQTQKTQDSPQHGTLSPLLDYPRLDAGIITFNYGMSTL